MNTKINCIVEYFVIFDLQDSILFKFYFFKITYQKIFVGCPNCLDNCREDAHK